MIEFVQIVVGGLLTGATYALVALGLYLVYRVTGVINLAQGAFVVLGALVTWSLQTVLGWNTASAVLVAVLATAAVGFLLGAATFVPGLAKLSNGNMLMLTAGLLTLMEGALLVLWGSQPYVLPPFASSQPVAVGSLLVPSQGFWVLGTAVLVAVALWAVLTRTEAGRALRACAENPMAARLVGVSVPRMTLLSFGLAAAMGAVAGVVVAPTTSLQFDTGRLFTISAFIAVVIGGLGSFSGAIVGSLLLGVISQLATAYVSSLFSNAITLSLLLVVLVFRPDGLIRAAVARRQDVREEARVAHITRLPRGTASIGGGVVAGLLAMPLAVTSPGVMSGLVIAGILFIALIGLDVVMGYAGQVNLGQAGFMAVGGYTAGYIATQYEIEPLLCVLAAIALAVLCSLVLSVVTVRLRGLYLALATLAFGLLVDSFAVGLIDITGGPSGLVGIPSFSVASLAFDTPLSMYYLVLGVNVVLVVLLSGAMRSGFGRALQAIRTDQLAAAALGVNVVRTKVLALAISAALGALSGSLYAFYFHFLSPDMVGTPRSLELVAMLIIGGEGTLVGPLLGSVMLTLLPTVFQPLALYKTFASGGLLVFFFLYLPQGLFGLLAGWLNRLAKPAGVPAAAGRAVGARVLTAPGTPAAGPALKVQGVSRSFGGLRAVSDVSFEVDHGTVCALIGPNGAGKTTVFNLITNLFAPDAGQVLLYGKPLAGVPPADIAARGLVRTFQTARVFPGMTVLENVLAGRHRLLRSGILAGMLRLPAARREERELTARAERLLALVGLLRYRDVHAVELPMGAQKQVEVIRALTAQPRLLLLDEPAAGLNDSETEELAALLRAIRDSGITVLVVEHNMSLVMNVADQVVVLEAGSLIAKGTPAEIQANPRVITAYLGQEAAA